MPHQKQGWLLDINRQGNQLSAFTVAGLGELLPKVENIVTMIFENGRCQMCLQQTPIEGKETPVFEAATEADARAKMLAYLLEKKLISSVAYSELPAPE
jgi:hypothetical protein